MPAYMPSAGALTWMRLVAVFTHDPLYWIHVTFVVGLLCFLRHFEQFFVLSSIVVAVCSVEGHCHGIFILLFMQISSILSVNLGFLV